MESLRDGFTALVAGANGGIGAAVTRGLAEGPRCREVIRLDRTSRPGFDLTDEVAIADAADDIRGRVGELDLIFDATGALDIAGAGPEKSLDQIDPDRLLAAFAVNTVGPALLLKHFADLMPRDRKSVFATLSARVGSIGDNRLGGWYAYRASKAALNQIVRTASIELARKRPDAVCVALHPGTVETNLSRRYAKGRFTHTPDKAAVALLGVLDGLSGADTGNFVDYDGAPVPW